jgi:hypothetical protein
MTKPTGNPYIDEVCKAGQGARCCRFLVMGPGGFRCGKLDRSLAATINARVAANNMNARGDNCEGRDPDVKFDGE